MIPIKIERREPVMKWIPVTEGLPDGGSEEYLVTIKHRSLEYKGRVVDLASYDARVSQVGIKPKWEGSGWLKDPDLYVVAWMPLPEPWRGEEG